MSTPKNLHVQRTEPDDGYMDITDMQDADDVPNDLLDAAEEFLETYGDSNDPTWYQEHPDSWH